MMPLPSDYHPETAADVPSEPRPAAFRELHGPRLRGFALLLTLGDEASATRLAADALAAGSVRVIQLSHPERAAAWLRQRVFREASDRASVGVQDGAGVVRERLGVDAAGFAALGALNLRERAALIATTVEQLDQRDVGTIVGLEGKRLERLVQRARRRVTAGAMGNPDAQSASEGPLVTRIRAIAARALT